MSQLKEIESRPNHKARIGLYVKPHRAIGFFVLATLDLVSITDESSKLRNRLPEPLDIMNHAGNFSISLWLGLGVTRLAGALTTRLDTSPRIMKAAAMGFGVGAVTLANTIAESKWGSSFGFTHNTADPIDAVYGIIAGTFAASIVDIEPVDKPDSYCASLPA